MSGSIGSLDQNALKTLVLDFLTGQTLCVIATVGADAKPESAIVGFSHNEQLELIIGTSNQSRKYTNLLQNPHVAIAIGGEAGEVQYEGRAEFLPDGAYKDMVEAAHIAKLPGAVEYREDPTQVYMKVRPSWIRFLKHGAGGGAQELTEFTA